jgi:thioesterase domain-containing protein/acyl carrier protein
VLLYDGGNGEEPRLVGYVVAPATASPSGIRKGLAERLPSYMVPSHIAVLDRFPIASSGKIDIAALPPPAWDEARHSVLRAPSDDREHELLKIWQEVLKIPNIGVDDDFFELGGTSLQALMVFIEIEARLGHSLSPTTIVQAPTIARLADFIRTSAGANNSHSLVPLRATGKGQPLFLVHNRYCFVMYYRHLLSALRSDRPVFGLQPPPLDGSHHIPRTVETMAADYVLEIRRAQPRGPYFLAGHSFGGLVSFEIAQQLVRAGESVSFLGLIDTILVNPLNDSHQDFARRLRVGHRLFAFFEKLNWISEIAWQRWYVVRLSLGQPVPYDHRTTWYDWVCRRASRNYVPKSYARHITMFSSVGNSERQKAHWGPLATGGLSIFEIAATHDDIVLPPYSKLLAEHFDACLDVTARRE